MSIKPKLITSVFFIFLATEYTEDYTEGAYLLILFNLRLG
ncbi:hypothetical protein SAMN06265367_103484 [Algoriphagus winogradskyi]|uniref:Uncharacterized protein n=1 Tax=Algoriphagus winogradskyi TaxID=237017 RepID=A0ABY1P1I2_9BACT|nr:hypothetical protein SAMN06265367_103484 [Algoriphagus winogradskyi]